jgi:hypothetical protein
MADIVLSREQFIDACPAELKKRIDDFFIFYSQKKKPTVFGSQPETGKKFFKNDQNKFEKKNNMTSFKKPFEKKISEFEKALNDFKGVLSKLNENNQEAMWEEIQELHLENKLAPPEEDGWSTVGTGNKKSAPADGSKEKDFSLALYQYTRNCSMYLSQYVEFVIRIRKSKELSVLANQYVDLAVADLDNQKVDNRAFNTLTHLICCELYINGLMTRKKYITSCILDVHGRIVKQLAQKQNTEESMEILLQNMKKCGNSVHKTEEVQKVLADLVKWKDTKTFTGKIHFNLIDLLELTESF